MQDTLKANIRNYMHIVLLSPGRQASLTQDRRPCGNCRQEPSESCPGQRTVRGLGRRWQHILEARCAALPQGLPVGAAVMEHCRAAALAVSFSACPFHF